MDTMMTGKVIHAKDATDVLRTACGITRLVSQTRFAGLETAKTTTRARRIGLTEDTNLVTCKRCLKELASFQSARAS